MRHLLLTFFGLVAATSVAGNDTAADAGVSIELNAAQDGTEGCTLSFLVENGHEQDIDQATYEVVLFSADGLVDRLTLFDFGSLPGGRPRVRQFVIPQTECGSLGRVLFNGAHACTGADESDACDGGLTLSTRTAIEVAG